MQVAAADIRRDELENDGMLDFPALWDPKLGISSILYLELVGVP